MRFAAATKGMANAAALGVLLSDAIAAGVTGGYHLLALPKNRATVAAEWLIGAFMPRQPVQLGLVRAAAVPLNTDKPELLAPSQ